MAKKHLKAAVIALSIAMAIIIGGAKLTEVKAAESVTVTINNSNNLLASWTGSGQYKAGGLVELNAQMANDKPFRGWYKKTGDIYEKISDQINCTVEIDNTSEIIADTDYNITFDLNGGSGISNRTYNRDTATFNLGTPSKAGCMFTGWTGSNGTSPQKTVQIAKGSAGDRSYTANWMEVVTVNWTGSLSKYGSYIGSDSATVSTHYAWKRIKYTNTGWGTSYANPYTAGSITIPKGTTIYFQMYAGGNTYETGGSCSDLEIYNGDYRFANANAYGWGGELMSGTLTPLKNCTISCKMDYSYNIDGGSSTYNGGGFQWWIQIPFDASYDKANLYINSANDTTYNPPYFLEKAYVQQPDNTFIEVDITRPFTIYGTKQIRLKTKSQYSGYWYVTSGQSSTVGIGNGNNCTITVPAGIGNANASNYALIRISYSASSYTINLRNSQPSSWGSITVN